MGARNMASKSEALGPVRADELYALEEFQQRVGLGRGAMREARRGGLRVRYVHGRAFVLGADWMEYVGSESKEQKNA